MYPTVPRVPQAGYTLHILYFLSTAEALGFHRNIVYAASDKHVSFKTSILNVHQIFPCK